MNILDIIAKKRDKNELTKEEIEYFIKEYTIGNVTDYQAAALVMAIYINGMNEQEITNLSLAMAHSGEILDLSSLGENIVDKHSTGGVGDKVSIILLPLIASLGIPVAKMSGRGLGFTGGTVDKMESIPGYKTNVEISDFILNVQKIGISMIGQTMNLAPADKKLYALRDTISCVESIPLIASSIMSKKIASGANKIVLDVTVGKGAFMKNKEDAQDCGERNLIRIDLDTGRHHQIRVQMAHAGMPLVGDRKYNPGQNSQEPLALCSAKLGFQHPVTKKQLEFQVQPAGMAFKRH